MTDRAVLPVEQQICFALYSASRSLTGRYRDLLEPYGITYPQYLVMLVLWESGTSTVRQLGDRLQLDSGTLSPLLKRLEALGFVSRTRSVADERVVLVEVTGPGADLQRHAAQIAEQICAATGLAPTELAELQNQISTLAARVREIA